MNITFVTFDAIGSDVKGSLISLIGLVRSIKPQKREAHAILHTNPSSQHAYVPAPMVPTKVVAAVQKRT